MVSQVLNERACHWFCRAVALVIVSLIDVLALWTPSAGFAMTNGQTASAAPSLLPPPPPVHPSGSTSLVPYAPPVSDNETDGGIPFLIGDSRDKVKQRLLDTYHVRATCEEGHFYGGLHNDECGRGLRRLEAALENVRSPMPLDSHNELSVQLGRTGDWQPLTFQEARLQMPYDAGSERMALYMNEQLKKIYGSSLSEIQKSTEEMANQMQEDFQLVLEQAANLNVVDYHDGLVNLKLALNLLVGAPPREPTQIRGLGFDVIELGHENTPLFEKEGQLKVGVSVHDKPGELAMHMIQLIRPDPFPTQVLARKTWGISKVVAFQLNRVRINDALIWFEQNWPQVKVDCQFVPANYGVNVEQCAQGLEIIQQTVAAHPNLQLGIPVDRVIVAKFLFADSSFRERVLYVNYTAGAASIYNALESAH